MEDGATKAAQLGRKRRSKRQKEKGQDEKEEEEEEEKKKLTPSRSTGQCDHINPTLGYQ